jgi:hypothetical protein
MSHKRAICTQKLITLVHRTLLGIVTCQAEMLHHSIHKKCFRGKPIATRASAPITSRDNVVWRPVAAHRDPDDFASF